MAVGRVGGTRSLIRGQVGSNIYQVKKNPDGSYSQIVYEKGVRTETTLTPRLQAQRMCMAMVESIMKDLKPVLGISFQGEKSRSRSANKFSSINAKLVMDDCRDHWYDDNLFVFPSRHRTDIEVKDLGGPFVISSGTLSYNLFDWFGDDMIMHHVMKDIPFPDGYFVGMVFNCVIGVTTIGEFLNNHRMTLKDCVAFCGYSEWINYGDNPDDPQSDAQHHYVLAEINPNLSPDTIMTEAVIKSMFKVQSDMQASVYIQTDDLAFGIGHAANLNDIDETWYYTAAFSISYYSDKQLISSSTYDNSAYGVLPWLWNSQPANVFGSWMGEPEIRPYPSPFV
jgi:hypothetical protein